MPPVQTAVGLVPGVALEGGLYSTGGKNVLSRIASGSIRFGILVYKASADSDFLVKQPPAPVYLGDADSIKTNGASTAGIVTYSGADFQGALGAAEFDYPMNLTLSNNAHADWDAGTWHIYGETAPGELAYDRWTQAADVANTELLTDFRIRFSKVHSIVRPAQTGTNGTFTIGTGLLLGEVTRGRCPGIALAIRGYEALATPVGYSDKQALDVLAAGEVWVLVEDAVVEGQQAYVRLVATGGEVRGAIRGTPDGTIGTAPDCSPIHNAKFTSAAGAGAFARLQLG